MLARLDVRFGTSVPLCCGSLAPPEAQPSSQANSGVEGKCSRSVLIFLTRNASRAAGLCSVVPCTNKPCGVNNRYKICIVIKYIVSLGSADLLSERSLGAQRCPASGAQVSPVQVSPALNICVVSVPRWRCCCGNNIL